MRVLTSLSFLLDCPAEETSTRIRLPTISSNRSSVPKHPQTVRAKTLDPAFFGVCGPTTTVCNHLENWQVGQRTRKDYLLVLFAPLSSAQGTEVPSNRSITSLHPLKKERNNFCPSRLPTSSNQSSASWRCAPPIPIASFNRSLASWSCAPPNETGGSKCAGPPSFDLLQRPRSLLEEVPVHGHGPRHKGLQVVNGLGAQLQPVLVARRLRHQGAAQLAVTARRDPTHQALTERRRLWQPLLQRTPIWTCHVPSPASNGISAFDSVLSQTKPPESPAMVPRTHPRLVHLASHPAHAPKVVLEQQQKTSRMPARRVAERRGPTGWL